MEPGGCPAAHWGDLGVPESSTRAQNALTQATLSVTDCAVSFPSSCPFGAHKGDREHSGVPSPSVHLLHPRKRRHPCRRGGYLSVCGAQ